MGAIVLGVALLVAVPSGHGHVRAHSSLAAASPGPGAVVGGEILTVQLIYTERIIDFDGSVTLRDGNSLASGAAPVSATEARIELASPLVEPGEYVVRHQVVASDGELSAAAFVFTFDPAAPPAVFLAAPSGDEGDTRRGWLIAGLALIGLWHGRDRVARRKVIEDAERSNFGSADARMTCRSS